MSSIARKIAFKTLGIKNYLRFAQRGFFLSYNLGFLKNKKEYEYHYFVEKLVNKGDTVVDIGTNWGYLQTSYLKTGLPHVYDKNRDGELKDQMFRFKAKTTILHKLKTVDNRQFLCTSPDTIKHRETTYSFIPTTKNLTV